MDVREKLVELLAKYFDIGDSYAYNLTRVKSAFACGTVGFDDFEEFDEETVADIADHLIANGVTVQEWIPASEPPKKITNKVIVLCKNGYRGFGHYEDYKGELTWYNLESGKPFTDWDLEDCESYGVTHWQPLPQPPKGE